MSLRFIRASMFVGVTTIVSAVSIFTSYAYAADKIVIYSARKENIDKPIFDAFTKQTGIVVESLHDDSSKLLARLRSEGKDTPADILLVVDSTNLVMATQNDIFKPIKSDVLNKAIPAEFRDEQNRWYGLSKRMRPIFYNKEKVKPEQLSTYEDLADPKWKGQVLIRSSSNAYNMSLLSAMVASNGVEKTQSWANGIASNLARPPQGGDTDQIKAIAAGEGTVGIANTYYYARMLVSAIPEDRNAAQKVGVFFPNQATIKGQMQGAHINISGAGVTNFSKKPELAVKFIEFLSTEPLQRLYADSMQEYPINVNVKPSDILQSFGSFKVDTTPVNTFGKYNVEAVRIADRSGWK
jgi:iron(III) transport system substrate-binding protein